MRKPKQKVTDSHVERVLALDAVAGILNYQDMTPEEAKAELFAMGERGEGKPKKGHPLRARWYNYTSVSSESYDNAFSKEHRARFPRWYMSEGDLIKEGLMLAAERGDCRPEPDSSQYKNWRMYTGEQSRYFDLNFYKKHRSIAPHWYKFREDTMKEAKEILLSLHIKPVIRSQLWCKWHKYTNHKDLCYDAEFTKRHKESHPTWYDTRGDNKEQHKKEILDMQRNGVPKPAYGNVYYERFRRYISKSNKDFDETFYNKCSHLKNNWIPSRHNDGSIAESMIESILRMAKEKKHRPNAKTKEGRYLNMFMCGRLKERRPSLISKLKRLAPFWFVKKGK